jgi:hypothetical protein
MACSVHDGLIQYLCGTVESSGSTVHPLDRRMDMKKWYSDMETLTCFVQNLSERYLIYRKSHMHCPRTELGLSGKEAEN